MEIVQHHGEILLGLFFPSWEIKRQQNACKWRMPRNNIHLEHIELYYIRPMLWFGVSFLLFFFRFLFVQEVNSDEKIVKVSFLSCRDVSFSCLLKRMITICLMVLAGKYFKDFLTLYSSPKCLLRPVCVYKCLWLDVYSPKERSNVSNVASDKGGGGERTKRWM